MRTLVGTAQTPMGDEPFEFAGERCVQMLDVVPPGTLGPGAYTYRAVAYGPGGELARIERKFLAGEPGPAR